MRYEHWQDCRELEKDPSDGLPCLVEVQIAFFAIESLHDVFLLFKGMHAVGEQASAEAGYVVYPFVSIESLEDYNGDD